MIGGSSAAAACGLDPFRSRVQLWLELTERVPRRDETEPMKWGTLLEPVIAAEVEAMGEYDIIPAPDDPLTGPEPFMVGHPDGYAAQNGDRGVLEIKTASAYRAREWEEGVPAAYMIQGQHYLVQTGLSFVVFAALIGGQKLSVRRVERWPDDELDLLVRAEAAFWRHVETDTPPDPDGSESADQMIRLLYPEATAGRVTLTEEDAALVEELRKVKAQAKRLTRQEGELEQKLKLRLGAAAVGWYGGGPLVRWSSVTSHRLDGDRLKQEYPEVADLCRKEITYRRFTLAG